MGWTTNDYDPESFAGEVAALLEVALAAPPANPDPIDPYDLTTEVAA